jgi:excinuclease ABC subunit B
MPFQLSTHYAPAGDQPQAIDELEAGLKKGEKYQTLLGVTGSGKTFTMANVIARTGKPALVIAHNKTLAAQLCNEFREFFPHNAVEYFVSYYDYYQPEAYMPSSDTYIEKEAMINQEIDRLRHASTQALLMRSDVIIVASVSCIYGLGAPQEYKKMHLPIRVGDTLTRQDFLRHMVRIQFERTNADLTRGHFRTLGEVHEIMPANQEVVVRVECHDDKVQCIEIVDPVSRKTIEARQEVWIFPAKHFIASEPERDRAIIAIREEVNAQLAKFQKEGKLLEAERLDRRVNADLAMLREVGYCNGIENYSRHLSGREAGAPPDTLLAYFPKDFVCFIDESHVTVSQLAAMQHGDAARKRTLVDYGFRLPSASDNRPLTQEEFLQRVPQVVFVSATPGPFEREKGNIVEQVIRPTGLVDPKVTICPVTAKNGKPGQIDDLIARVVERAERKERSLVTTLTKKMAEDLTQYLKDKGMKVQYLHSDVKTIERVQILTELRKGTYDVLIGVNLLREGLDLPEVTLVAILDADKEGFLRSETSLIQTIGRAARNVDGEVILYADSITPSIKAAIAETDRRRAKQIAYNEKHGITPKTVQKAIKDIMEGMITGDAKVKQILALEEIPDTRELQDIIKDKEKEMREAAKDLQFELAAVMRDELRELYKMLGGQVEKAKPKKRAKLQ